LNEKEINATLQLVYMKNIIPFLFVVTLVGCKTSEKKVVMADFSGIGELKLGMSKAELEKLLGTTITLKKIGIEETYMETINAKYMDMDMELQLMRSDFEDKVAILDGVLTTSSSCETKEGIGIGTDRAKIIETYESHLLIINNDTGDKNKITSTIKLVNIDNDHECIIFSLVNNKVVSIEVAPTPEFRDRE
jgi:hypothetical protein